MTSDPMLTPDPIMLLATARGRELQAEARRHALVRRATRCRPSALSRTAHALAVQARALAGRDVRAACCA